MKLKNIVKLALISSLAITSFTACGSGGGGSDASFLESETKIDITIPCITNRVPTIVDIDNYITLNSGDTIVKTTATTTISTYHDTNGIKKVCLVNGSAYILRK